MISLEKGIDRSARNQRATSDLATYQFPARKEISDRADAYIEQRGCLLFRQEQWRVRHPVGVRLAHSLPALRGEISSLIPLISAARNRRKMPA
jgi:hypothetical protein